MPDKDQESGKDHLHFEGQAQLLAGRGLVVANMGDCIEFLSHANYYRFSGYTRFFQDNPATGNNTFTESADFSHVRSIYELDQEMRNLCLRGLTQVESVLRTQFAYIFARDVSPYQKYLDEDCYLPSTTQGLVSENIFKDLDRSKEPYVAHFRVLDDSKPPSAPTYPKMPIWAAVEAMSFGTLSKCLERCRDQEITKLVADAVGVTRQGFASQIRSFVYLRNRSAHHSRLWNHSVIDAPPLANNVRNRAKRSYGQFDTRSIFQIIVVLANFLDKAGLDSKFIQEVEELLARNSDFNQGIKNPTKIAK